jgi:hypothetical protein
VRQDGPIESKLLWKLAQIIHLILGEVPVVEGPQSMWRRPLYLALLLRKSAFRIRVAFFYQRGLAVDKDQYHREFKVGEKVRFTVTGISVTILGLERYRTPGRIGVRYKIKLPNGIRVAQQDELEPLG